MFNNPYVYRNALFRSFFYFKTGYIYFDHKIRPIVPCDEFRCQTLVTGAAVGRYHVESFATVLATTKRQRRSFTESGKSFSTFYASEVLRFSVVIARKTWCKLFAKVCPNGRSVASTDYGTAKRCKAHPKRNLDT